MGARLAAPGGMGQGAIGVVFALRGCVSVRHGFRSGWLRGALPGGAVAHVGWWPSVGGHHAGRWASSPAGRYALSIFALATLRRAQGRLWPGAAARCRFGVAPRRDGAASAAGRGGRQARRRPVGGPGGRRARFRSSGRSRLGHRRGADCGVAGLCGSRGPPGRGAGRVAVSIPSTGSGRRAVAGSFPWCDLAACRRRRR